MERLRVPCLDFSPCYFLQVHYIMCRLVALMQLFCHLTTQEPRSSVSKSSQHGTNAGHLSGCLPLYALCYTKHGCFRVAQGAAGSAVDAQAGSFALRASILIHSSLEIFLP